MKITWIGHSCFKIESGNFSVVVDPYANGSVPGLKPVCEEANVVLCSHQHGDHNAADRVKVTASGLGAFEIQKIETFHDEAKGTKRGNNTIHVISDGKIRIAHLGDLGCELEEEQKNILKNLDVMLVPVGGFFTIDAAQAAQMVCELQPKYVIPMHYRNGNTGYDVIGTIDLFTDQMEDVTNYETSVFDTDADEKAKVIVLKPQNKEA